MNYVLMRRHLC